MALGKREVSRILRRRSQVRTDTHPRGARGDEEEEEEEEEVTCGLLQIFTFTTAVSLQLARGFD